MKDSILYLSIKLVAFKPLTSTTSNLSGHKNDHVNIFKIMFLKSEQSSVRILKDWQQHEAVKYTLNINICNISQLQMSSK